MVDIKGVAEGLLTSVMSYIPENYKFVVYLGVYSILIALYALFVWKFYKFLAKRNIVDLDLWQYIRTEHHFFRKSIAAFFYLVEYVIALPFMIFFWYALLSLFFLLLAKEQTIGNILLMGMAIVAAVRICAYFSGELAKDLAKMLPLTLLAVFITTPGFFSVEGLIARIGEIPLFVNTILSYIIFVVILEFILRILYTIKQFFVSVGVKKKEVAKVEVAETEAQTGLKIPKPTKEKKK